MADGTTFVKVTSSQSTPEDYLLSGAASLDLLAVRAEYDGSGAAGDFLPVVQIVNEAGEVMLTFVGEKVTAGDSASITFAPFLKGVTAASPSGSGLQFDTDPQAGDWFEMQTTSSGVSPSGWGIQIADLGNDGLQLQSPLGGIDIRGAGLNVVSTSDIALTSSGGAIRLDGSTAPSDISVKIPAGHMFLIELATLAKIFEVRGDGTIHGKASVGAITWDL
jgi:hypothetical protein